MSSYSVLKRVETGPAAVEVCSDTIVRVLFKKESEIDARELKNLFDTYNSLTEGKPFGYIYSAEDGTANLNGEAKKFGRLNPNYFKKKCIAVVVKSLAQRIMADFYLKIIKSDTPYKVFGNMEDAEKWCRSIIDAE